MFVCFFARNFWLFHTNTFDDYKVKLIKMPGEENKRLKKLVKTKS